MLWTTFFIVLKVKTQAEFQNIQESFALKTEVQNRDYRERFSNTDYWKGEKKENTTLQGFRYY